MSSYCNMIECNCKYHDEEEGCMFYYNGSGEEEDKPCYGHEDDKMITTRISVTEFLTDFSDIEDINYTGKIIVFSEGYSDEEYDKIYDLLHNKWGVNKLRYLNKLVGHNGSGPVYDTYDDNHSLIKRQLILVENCDLEVIESAYDLWEYLDMGYELYLVCCKEEGNAKR